MTLQPNTIHPAQALFALAGLALGPLLAARGQNNFLAAPCLMVAAVCLVIALASLVRLTRLEQLYELVCGTITVGAMAGLGMYGVLLLHTVFA